MGNVGTFILGRARPLPGHRLAEPHYTLSSKSRLTSREAFLHKPA